MGRKRKRHPAWTYDDNPYSNYAIITCDLLKSDQYKALSTPERLFLLTSFGMARDNKGYGCLLKHGRERNKLLNQAEHADDSLYADWKNGYFVCNKSLLEDYGYSSSYGSQLLKSLRAKGFIDIIEQNKARKKVNVYKFSSRWKAKK